MQTKHKAEMLKLAFNISNVSLKRQTEIAQAMNIFNPGDDKLEQDFRSKVMIQKAERKQILYALWDLVEFELKTQQTNPFNTL